jgi:hypothetical protein
MHAASQRVGRCAFVWGEVSFGDFMPLLIVELGEGASFEAEAGLA